mgnify:CR=1 FL=1
MRLNMQLHASPSSSALAMTVAPGPPPPDLYRTMKELERKLEFLDIPASGAAQEAVHEALRLINFEQDAGQGAGQDL